MNWIKKRYDQFILALIAAALLVSAIVVHLKTGSFSERFAEAKATVPINKNIPPLKLGAVEEAKDKLQNPPVWAVETDYENGTRGSLIVSQHYIIGESGVPKKPIGGAARIDSLTKKPIPNRWFMNHSLS